MPVTRVDDTEPAFFNLFQVIALDIVVTAVFLTGLRVSDNTWSMSVLGAWLGGCFTTLGVVAVAYWILTRSSRSGFSLDAPTSCDNAMDAAALTSQKIDDPLALWEADRMLERDHFLQSKEPDLQSEPKPASPVQMGAMHDDSDDSAELSEPVRPRRAV